MASESTEDGTLTVNLPGDLSTWLSERAQTLDVDRETVLVQLLASYHAADELDDGELPATDPDAIERVVTEKMAEAADTFRQDIDAVQQDVDSVEQHHEDDIEDVRGRVVQLKQELDGKATADHTHAELDRLDDLQTEVSDIRTTVDEIEAELGSTVDENSMMINDVDERLDTLQERLKTVAWVVSDLRDAHESREGIEAVYRIKRAAAKADVGRAKCENCGSGVEIGLLTEPECPHCEATVTNVESANSWFGKPRLLAASQLESGDVE